MRASETSMGGARRELPETIWETIRRVGAASTGVRREGLAELFLLYWKPIYYYIRASWHKSNEDAKDLTQAFFLWLLENTENLQQYDPEQGGFRTYLKTVLKHFVYNQEKALRCLKRRGAAARLNLDEDQTLDQLAVAEPAESDPEKAFDRAWVNSLIARAFRRVRDRLAAAGEETRFRVFEEYELSGSGEPPTYLAVAQKLGLKESDVRNYLFAVRGEIRAEIRADLARMTSDPRELAEEWNAFFEI
jgi:RNA polymerase sigma factor (sigma-70 family)